MLDKQEDTDLKIAIVNNSAYALSHMTKILETAGFDIVCSTRNPELALRGLEDLGANLFIIDFIMPSKSGREMAKNLLSKSKKIKIIFLSPFYHQGLLKEIFGPRVVDFLPRPIKRIDLVRAVRKVELDSKKERENEVLF